MKGSQASKRQLELAQRIRNAAIALAAAMLAMCMAAALPGAGMGAQGRAWADDAAETPALAAAGLSPASATVELYRVQVSGGIGGAVGVGDTLTATASKLRAVQGSTSTVEVAVEADDEVAYQWQYANTSTTLDSAFSDIEGATAATYTIAADMQGKYLRVKAQSQNTVVSTKKPFYGSTQSVSPLGPVQAAAGAVQLDSVSIVSTLSNSMWVGATVTPTAKYLPSGSYVSTPVPQDAAVTYTWKVADSASGPFEAFDAASFPKSSVSASGELSVGTDLAGKYVCVEANALVNTVRSLTWQVLPQGVYDLMRITFGFDTLYTGGTIVTTLQAKTLEYENDYSFGTTVPIDDPNTSYQWYSTSDEPRATGDELDFSDCTWTPVEGATGADLDIPDSAKGCYVKVVATSAKDGIGTSVERASTTRVLVGGGLQQALEKLEFFHPTPKWGTATNMNDIVAEKLASIGYADVAVKTKSFERTVDADKAHLGVSAADDATNGDVTFFSYDDAASSSYHNFAVYHQAKVTFELSREGESPVDFEVVTNIPWDLDAAQAIFDAQAEGLAIGFAEGDSADAVTQDMTLPCKAGILWVTWTSSNEDAVIVHRDEGSASALWDPYTGIVRRGADDAPVVVTAVVDATLIDSADDTLEALSRHIEFPVTVKGDTETIIRMNEALAGAIDASFAYANVKDSATGAAIDKDAVVADLQLPTTRTLFGGSVLSSSDYRVTYASDDDGTIRVNGYRATVMRPLPGADAAEASITVTVTHKTMPAVTYSKALSFRVSPLVESEVDADIGYMEQVKESVFAGYGEGLQEQDAITADLHPFQRAYFTDDGQLHWKYATSDMSDAACTIGFTPGTVDDRPSSDASYERFVSSHPGVIADGSLRVTRATRDIGVSVTCCLTSDRFGAYYERYKGDPACPEELKEKFAKLYRQKVTVAMTVKGIQVSAAVLEALGKAADDAEALAESVSVSEDGSDVMQDAEWVDAATMGALTDAITRARAVAAKDNATDADVADAQQAIEEALESFNAARRPGTYVFVAADDAQKADLASAADAVEALLDTVYTSVDGSDIAAGKSWAPAEVVDRLSEAIAKARALAASRTASEGDVREAIGELALARAAFERSMRSGLLPASAGVAKAGESYAAGSGASAASYLVKTTATASAQGTVWFAASMAPKTAKSVIVPATVRIKGATYRVVGVSSGAFKNMKKLKKATIGENVAKIAKSAFKNTPKLNKIVVKGASLCKKASVKGALKGSKAGKVTVKVPKKARKAAKKAFTKKNLKARKAVKVK